MGTVIQLSKFRKKESLPPPPIEESPEPQVIPEDLKDGEAVIGMHTLPLMIALLEKEGDVKRAQEVRTLLKRHLNTSSSYTIQVPVWMVKESQTIGKISGLTAALQAAGQLMQAEIA